MTMAKYDWTGVEEYVLRKKEINYKELSRRFDIPVSSIKHRSSIYKWRQKIAMGTQREFSTGDRGIPRDEIVAAIRTATAWDRIDASAGRLCEALLRQVMLNVNASQDDRPIDTKSLNQLVNSTVAIVHLARSVKGDIGQALGVFTEAGLLPEDYAPQLLEAIESGDRALREGLKKVFTGQVPD